MIIQSILSKVDHTLLSLDATWDQIQEICDEAIKYKTASVCIPACYIKKAKEYAGGILKVGTVIGFPCGYSTTDAKVFEAGEAVSNGADKINMVINIGMLKEKIWQYT